MELNDDDYTLCDCCGSYASETADQDGDGNPLGHVQCAQCSRIAELESQVRDRDEIIKGTAEQYAKIVKEQGSKLGSLLEALEVDDQGDALEKIENMRSHIKSQSLRLEAMEAERDAALLQIRRLP